MFRSIGKAFDLEVVPRTEVYSAGVRPDVGVTVNKLLTGYIELKALEDFSKELLELIWVLERTVALGPKLDSLLDEIVSSPTILANELPQPSEAERKPPS